MEQRNLENIYPVSPVQEAMLSQALATGESGVSCGQLICPLRGDLDLAAFQQAWQQVMEEHALLRTSFAWLRLDRPLQIVHRRLPLPLASHDWRQLAAAEQESRWEVLCREDLALGFDPSRPPLWRATLCRTAEDDSRLLFTFHPLVLDRTSLSLILEDVLALYEGSSGVEGAGRAPSRPFRDYIEWLKPQDPSQSRTFWRQSLAGLAGPTVLPVGRGAGEARSGDSVAEEVLCLSRARADALAELAGEAGLSLSTILLGAWALLLARYSGVEDVLFGVTLSGRPRDLEGSAAMVGPFANTLPLRAQVDPELTLRSWLKRLQCDEEALRCSKASPITQILEWADVPADLLLFETCLVPDGALPEVRSTAPDGRLELGPLQIRGVRTAPLALEARWGSEPAFRMSYDSHRFDAPTVARLLSHFRNLLERIAAQPDARVAEVSLLSPDERHQLLVAFNDTRVEGPCGEGVVARFEAQAEQNPEAVAVVWDSQKLSYRELNARANQLAHHLQAMGVGPEIRIGLCARRSLEMIVGILGILKAGGAYVPLDPAYPLERLAFMLDDAQVPVLLTQESLLDTLPGHWGQVICLDSDWEQIAEESEENPPPLATAEDLAYVIYTSGSTGKPKGVLVTHGNLAHSTTARRSYYRAPLGNFVLLPSFAFDSSVAGLFWTLCDGGTLLLPTEEIQEDPGQLVAWIGRHAATHLLCVPSLYALLISLAGPGELETLRVAIVAGEACPAGLAERHHRRLSQCALYNEYGPTEATVWSTVYQSRGEETDGPVPIGRPIANTRVYVLDARGEPLPIGLPGELHIGGDGVARGYLNRPDLTEEKFVPDPFHGEPGARLYRTGDLARYRPDGVLEFLGRLDDQVKVRGYRIELGEIEAVLGQAAGVRECVVAAREETPGDTRLVAYVVPEEDEVGPGELRRYLQGRLPEYMVPAVWVMLERLPVTANGKVDRKALPAPEAARREAPEAEEGPRTPAEETLAEIWADVLGLAQVGIHDNFFELGGHSLLATQVISRVRESFRVELQLRPLFENPTVAELAAYIEGVRGAEGSLQAPPLHPASRDRALPLSFAQQRLWFIDQLEPGSPLYNVPSVMRLQGELRVAALQQTLDTIVARHEVLRTTYAAEDGVPIQIIAEPGSVPMPVIDLQACPEAEREAEAERLAAAEARTPFDLTRAPLLRSLLLRLAPDDHILVLTLHHIASDGWSVGVLNEEMVVLYEAFASGRPCSLPELPIQYADFAVWQRDWLQGEVLEQQLAYWKQQLAGAPATLELPGDRPRPAMPTYRGAWHSFRLSEELSVGLQALSQHEGATLFMSLFAGFQTLLHRYTGQVDLVVGTDVANRNRLEIEGLIGFFLNHLVLRTDLSGDPSFRELLARVRAAALEAYAHQDVPFDKLVEALKPERNLSHSPIFQVLFVLQNLPRTTLELQGLSLSYLPINHGMAKFDLALFMGESEHGLVGTWVYQSDRFDAATITRMTGHFETLLGSIVTQPDAPIDTLEMLTEVERGRQMEEQKERQQSQLSRLRGARRKTVDLANTNPIEARPLSSGEAMPLLVQPAMEDLDLIAWSKEHRGFIEERLHCHGALLFRGFGLHSLEAFEQFASALCPDLFSEYGDLPRAGASTNVYTSTPYPSDQAILFHNESSHLHCWPMRIWFFCMQAAQQGGETPIMDCRKVYQRLDPGLRDRFAHKGLMYVRNFTDGLDVSWQSFFRTQDRSEVEVYCREAGMEWEWKKDNGLRTRQARQAVTRHPVTGETLFFNQIQLHHIACLQPEVRRSLLSMFGEAELPRHVYYGDGTPIEESVMEEVGKVCRECAVSFPWEEGDVLMLDNMLVAHARNPYVGPRRIVVAMGQMMNSDARVEPVAR